MTALRVFSSFALLVATLLLPQLAVADEKEATRQYDNRHPLIYEDAWDLWPYCYLDEQGHPVGYNVELVKLLCDRLNIPYVVRLKPTREALADLKAGESDLMLGMNDSLHACFGRFSNSVVQLFTHSVVYPPTLSQHVKSAADLQRQKVIVHRYSFSHCYMRHIGAAANALPHDDMRGAIQEVSSTQKGQIVWNTMSLKWLMRKYQIGNLKTGSVDMPHGEYRFMSNDTALLARLDSVFAIVKSDYRQMEHMQNRWFYPERQATGIPSWVWYTTLIAAALMLLLIYWALTYRYREQHYTALSKQRTKRLAMILQTNSVDIWTYDVDRQMFAWLGSDGKEQQEQTALEFARRFNRDDFDRLCEGLRQVIAKEQEQVKLDIEALPTDQSTVIRRFVVVLSVLRSDKGGRPTLILGTRSDVSAERDRQNKAKALLTRYRSIFHTAMTDMVSFNSEGMLVNMNERAQRVFHLTLEEAKRQKLSLMTLLENPHLDMQQLDYYYVTRFMNDNAWKPHKQTDTQYYEMQLVPIYDGKKLLGVYGTGRMVTEMVKNYRHIKENTQRIAQAYQAVTDYVKNIDYAMRVGGVRLAVYSPGTHTLTIMREINVEQIRLTQSRCMTLVADPQKKLAMRLLNSMDNGTTMPIDAEIATTLRVAGMTLWLHFHFIPISGADGHVTQYFGMCRDISEMKATEQQLAKETERAREVEELKNSFLRNMSYEIRTPLNAVVGFAELFEMPHTHDDEDVFIQEIKDNAAHLLSLINDILFLSRLDAHMIDISKMPTDFAKTFEGHCQLGWSNQQKEGVRYTVENHYEQLVADIDDANLGRVIEQIVANAARHTHSGMVRARYDYVGSKLIIAIEDTGEGMSDEQLKHIFQRFSNTQQHGTGLGLPICQELITQMGGTIEVNSELGKGTTVWITLPCTATDVQRKTQL